MAHTKQSSSLDRLLQALFRGELTEPQARQLAGLGPEAVQLALLAASNRIARLQPASSPSTPSGMVPVYQKPATDKRRQRKPWGEGRAQGQPPQDPEKIDAHVEHRLEGCLCCGGELQRCSRERKRIIEDIPEQITPVVTEHTIHRDFCPGCKKHVEPVVPDAMPNATLGHHVVALSSWFHYGQGVTIGQVRDILGSHLHTEITAGGLLAGWQRLAETLFPWYEQIGRDARAGAVLHADETGWRVDGQTHWLWCFANQHCCCYLIDQSRGGLALQKFFTEAYLGALVSDFWAAYDSGWTGDKQKCLPIRSVNSSRSMSTTTPWSGKPSANSSND